MAITYIINFQSNFSGTDYMRKGKKKTKNKNSNQVLKQIMEV